MSAGLPVSAPVDSTLLRRALGAFASGVTVVTVGGEHPHGMTANSFTSVSLDPPLVLVCVGRSAVMHAKMAGAGTFGVSVLAAHHERVGRHFADRTRPLGAAQFDAVDWLPGRLTGVPLIDGALVIFGGALLLTPGFLSDILGLILLLPPTRALVRGVLVRRFSGRLMASASRGAEARMGRIFSFQTGRPRGANDDDIIDADATEVDPRRPELP